jgi:hypothetical protein
MGEWYTVVDSDYPLQQGDVLYNCPVFFPDPSIDYTNLSDPCYFKIYNGI